MGFKTMEKEIGLSPVTGVKAYGEFPTANQLSITSKEYGIAQNDFFVEVLGGFRAQANSHAAGKGVLLIKALETGTAPNSYTLTITDTVSAGAETITWGENSLVIEVADGVSTTAQVLAAEGGITGTPWAELSLVTEGAVDAVAQTAMSALDSYVAGIEGEEGAVAGSEELIWSEFGLTVKLQSGVSTIAQLLAAAGGITGTPWADLAAIAANGTTVAAMARTAVRDLPDSVKAVAPVSESFDLYSQLGLEIVPQLVVGLKKVKGSPVVVFEKSDSNFLGVKASALTQGLKIEAKYPGPAPSGYTVVIAGNASKGSETIVWSNNGVTINVEAGVSTVADVLAAAGGVSGSPIWGVITKGPEANLTDTVAAVSSTAISSLTSPVLGKIASRIAGSNMSPDSLKYPKKQLLSSGDRYLRVLGFGSGLGAKVRMILGY